MKKTNDWPAKGVVPPREIVTAVSRLVEATSAKAAAEKLGIGVGTVRALRGALTVSRGTLALVRERLAGGERAS
jgi:hypothetical protein